ncbi:MAG TPA: hypothetical protein VEX40_02390 [Mycobacterium sp.]|nr:hypothetical protein [Mycobacterium sp.]
MALVIALSIAGLAAAAMPAAAGRLPGAKACPLFPRDNVWNMRVDDLPVHPDSDTLVASIGVDAYLHPDFGSYQGYGIPWNVVSRTTKRSTVTFRWPGESDAGPYPIPTKPKIEGGSDRHILMVDKDRCKLFELFAARRKNGRWRAGSGAIWDLRSNRLRPAGWTSADAAGLPILPGLVRFDEIRDGEIPHALRFTAPLTRRAYVYPARHQASEDEDPDLPPMGLRLRLKASVDISGYPRQARILLRALQTYGMILADNGSPWYVTGAPHPSMDDDGLHLLHRIKGSDFEVVDTSALRNGD